MGLLAIEWGAKAQVSRAIAHMQFSLPGIFAFQNLSCPHLLVTEPCLFHNRALSISCDCISRISHIHETVENTCFPSETINSSICCPKIGRDYHKKGKAGAGRRTKVHPSSSLIQPYRLDVSERSHSTIIHCPFRLIAWPAFSEAFMTGCCDCSGMYCRPSTSAW